MLIPAAPVLNNNKSIDYFNEFPNQHHLLSQQTIISPHKKKRWQRKEKGRNKKKKRKERKNSNQHSLLCFPCDVSPSPSKFPASPLWSLKILLLELSLFLLFCLLLTQIDNATSVHDILLICISSFTNKKISSHPVQIHF